MTESSPLPSGTITLLFTDIERSSQKWDHFPDEMRAALARHDEILGAAISEHRGVIVKQKGDGYFAAFPSALDAVNAVVQSQAELDATDWHANVGPLRVRMALHTGFVEPAAGDYHGPEVNKVARLEAVAHGGQVLLSSSAAAQVLGVLPDGVNLDDLGSHRLRSLARPDHIYQLAAPALVTSFPPLRTEAFERKTLPTYRTSFVGRDREITDIADLVGQDDCRLLTLVGPGGTGKTRLAVESAARLAADRSHGAAFVPLGAVLEPEGVLPAMAEALDFTFDLHSITMIDHQTQLFDYLATQGLILVFDNFEHLIAASRLVTELISFAPQVDVVVTSRQPLNVEGEWILEIGGMDLQSDGDVLPAAVELFRERARQAKPDFHIDPGNIDDIRRICDQVLGMPLGIELAAPWVSVLSCKEIADEIARNLDFLESDRSDAAEKHRSLRAVFESSWGLLSEQQKTVLVHLSIFPAPFSREAATAVIGASIRTLMELRSRSLIRQSADGNLQMHPLLRQYISELVPAEEGLRLSTCHARFYVDRLLVREADLRGGSNQLDAARELAEENDNLRRALEWAVVNRADDEVVDILGAAHQLYLNLGWYEGREQFVRLVRLIGDAAGVDRENPSLHMPYLWAAAYLSVFQAALAAVDEGEDLIRHILPAWEDIGGKGLATCRYSLGVLAAERGDYSAAQAHLAAALDEAHESEDAVLIGTTLLWHGWVTIEEGDLATGRRLFDECLSVMSNPPNHWGKAFALSKLGVAADSMGDHRRAAQYHHESREMFAKTNDVAGQAFTLSRLSLTYWLTGDYLRARDYGLEGLELFEQVNHRWGVSASLCRVGFAELSLRESDSAGARFLAALDESERVGLLTLNLYALIGIGAVLTSSKADERAVEILSFVLEHPSTPAQYHEFADPSLALLRSRMKPDALAAAWSRGVAGDLAQTVTAARAALHQESSGVVS